MLVRALIHSATPTTICMERKEKRRMLDYNVCPIHNPMKMKFVHVFAHSFVEKQAPITVLVRKNATLLLLRIELWTTTMLENEHIVTMQSWLN